MSKFIDDMNRRAIEQTRKYQAEISRLTELVNKKTPAPDGYFWYFNGHEFRLIGDPEVE